jgi:DNA polymerase III subunit delta'
MAEETPDPREVEWHPRRRVALHGHEAAEARLLQAVQSGKLHHAWLISGPRGIGKATLAYRFARYLSQPPSHLSQTTLAVPEDAPSAHLLAAGAHPNIFVLQRAMDQRAKRLKTEIAVDDAREAISFTGMTSATGGWRIVIVDSADDLNLSSANALLKMIEEPPPRSLILIVCHQPGRLLRTIRSRCIHLHLAPLSEATVVQVLRSLPEKGVKADDATRRLAASLSRGSPGRALDLLGSKGAAAFVDLQSRQKLTPAGCIELAAPFGGRVAAEDYAVFCELLTGWVANKARESALLGGGDALARAHDDIIYSLRQADALNLDRRQTVTDALMRVEEALKAS